MKKFIMGGALFIFSLSFFLFAETESVKVVVVAASVRKSDHRIADQIKNVVIKKLSSTKYYSVVKEISPDVLKEIKLKLLQGEKFPPQVEEQLSANALLLVKLYRSGGSLFVSSGLIDSTTGEIVSSQAAEFTSASDIGVRIFNQIEKYYKNLPPVSKLKIGKNHYWMQVIANGLGKGPRVVARKVALLDAKRRALEKALGVVVNVKEIPEAQLREVESRVQGTLKYSILKEGTKGKMYSMVISASVKIPAALVEKYPSFYQKIPVKTGFTPLVVKKMSGISINWEEGYLLATGKGKIVKGDPLGLIKGRRAAIVDAQGKALQGMDGIRVEGEKIAGDLGMEYYLKGIVAGGNIVKEWREGDEYFVQLKVPIFGVNGLTGLLLDPDSEGPYSYLNKNSGSEIPQNLPYSGIVIDAAGLGVQPSVFVAVYDEDGNILYSKNKVDPGAVKDMGMASFVLKEKGEGNFIKVGSAGFPLFVASNVNYIFLARRHGRGTRRYYHKRKKKWWYRFRRRQGRRPLRVRAIALPRHGRIRTGAVISTHTGKVKKVRKIIGKVFWTARVVIITDATVGGTEGFKYDPRFLGWSR